MSRLLILLLAAGFLLPRTSRAGQPCDVDALWTTSWYVDSHRDPSEFYSSQFWYGANSGYHIAQMAQTGHQFFTTQLVQFGHPITVGGQPWVYGYRRDEWPRRNYSLREAATAALQYAAGLHYGMSVGGGAPGTPVQLVFAVTNFEGAGSDISWEYGVHFGYWAHVLQRSVEYYGWDSEISVAAGWDVELDTADGWALSEPTLQMALGYAQYRQVYAPEGPPLVNNGSVDGCPPYGDCLGDYSQDDVYRITWLLGDTALPQIYNTRGAQARQWASLVQYAWSLGHDVDVLGPLVQSGACMTRAGCSGTDNNLNEGWSQLCSELNADPATAQSLPQGADIFWQTDLRWY